tara:strand:- start:320 stop:838 length:519 start_codon:yes stop_codon:yes gene_type:complete
MDWEDQILSASAAYVTQNGGDILEIGFGMGISANYIQSHSIDTHTIIENHPDMITKATSWAANKSNVYIVTSSWYDALQMRYVSNDGKTWQTNLGEYDGIFYNTYGDIHMYEFSSSLNSLSKLNGVATWWNSTTGSNNYYNIPDVTYDIIDVNPPENTYFNHKKYYLPKKGL